MACELWLPSRTLNREEHLVEETKNGGVEVLLVGSLLALEFVALRMTLRDSAVSLLCGVELPGGLLYAAHRRLVAREDTEVVLLAQPVEEALHLFGWNLGIGTHNHENAAAAHSIGHLVERRQRQDLLVSGLARRLEHLAQPVADQVVDLVLRRVVGEALEELRQVLLAVEVETVLGRAMQVPRGPVQLLERPEELGRFAQGRDKALHHLLAGQALHGIDRRRQARRQQQ